MVCIFFLMVSLCLTELISDFVLEIVRRLRVPRARLCRARQYRFN